MHMWVPCAQGFTLEASYLDEYAGTVVLAKTSRKVFFKKKEEPYDRTAVKYLQRYRQLECCSDSLRNEIVEARQAYTRTSIGSDMERVLSEFYNPLSEGRIRLGFVALRRLLNTTIRGCASLSFKEACGQISEFESSPGWPYTDMGYGTRRMLLESGMLEKWTEEFEASGKHSMWTGCLKEEVLKRKKYDKGLIRFFACCPMPTQVVILKYSAEFNTRVQILSQRGTLPTYIGVSPFMGGWNRLFSPFSDKRIIFSLDESQYDTTIHRTLFMCLYMIRNSLLRNPLSDEKLEWLVDEVCRTYIITDTGEVIRKSQGNASGSPNTIVDNSLILLMIYFEAYYRKYPADTLEEFFQHVNLSIIGDDNICGVDTDRENFKMDDVMTVMDEWGMRPRIESVTTSIIGAHYVSKDIGIFEKAGMPYLVPLPSRVRLLAHYIYSTPGSNILASAIKCNSLMLEVVFQKDLWDMFYMFQTWYATTKSDLDRWTSEDMPVSGFFAAILPRDDVIDWHIGLEGLNQRGLYKKESLEMPNQTKKQTKTKKKRAARKKAAASSSSLKTTKIPLAKSVVVRTTAPKISSVGGRILVTHREFVTDVTGTGLAFSGLSFRINACNVQLFPWLAGIAGSYEKYKFQRLAFTYLPACSMTTPGSVMLAVDYDVIDPAPTAKTEMLSYKGCARAPAHGSVTMRTAADDAKTLGAERFTLAGSYPPLCDPKTYDLGNLFVCTSLISGMVGEVYVEYAVELITPQANTMLAPDNQSVKVVSGTSTSKANPFGDVGSVTTVGNLAKYVGTETIAGRVKARFNLPTGAASYLASLYTVGTGLTSFANVGMALFYDIGTWISNAAALASTVNSTSTNMLSEYQIDVPFGYSNPFVLIDLNDLGTTVTSDTFRLVKNFDQA